MNAYEAINEIKNGKLRPVYLVYGNEPFLAEELLAAIRSAAVQSETADFNFHVIHAAADQIPQALSIARTEPFFAERRLVVVRDCPLFSARKKQAEDEGDDSGDKAGSTDEAMMAYLKSPVPSTCLVLVAGETIDSRKKVTKAATATGGAVECTKLKEEDAVRWAQQRAASYGKKLADSPARLLFEKVGADLRLIDLELEKLSCYVGEAKQISVTDVDTLVGGIAETEIFRLTEAVMLKERPKALVLLDRVMRQVDHPLQVVVALTNRFRQILTIKTLLARGVSIKEGAALAKMHPYPYEKMLSPVRAYPRDEIVRGLEKLLAADVAIKSGQDPVLTVQTLLVQLMP